MGERRAWRRARAVWLLAILAVAAPIAGDAGAGARSPLVVPDGRPPPTLPTYTLTVSVSGSGTVTGPGISCPGDCSESFVAFSEVTLTASPELLYAFSSRGGDCSGTSTTCTLTMNGGKSATASFVFSPPILPPVKEPPPPDSPPLVSTQQVSVEVKGAGTVTSSPVGVTCPTLCTASFVTGTSVTLSAAAASGYAFDGWQGACTGTSACALTLNAAASVTAVFRALPPPPPTQFAVTVTRSGGGSVTSGPGGIACGGTCTSKFPAGSVVTLAAAPAQGNVFARWGGACTGTLPTCALQVAGPTAVEAVFAHAPARLPAMTITRTTFAPRWRASRFLGHLVIVGHASRPGFLRIAVTRRGPIAANARTLESGLATIRVRVAAGSVRKRVRLPQRLLPGRYAVRISGPGLAKRGLLTLPGPPEGVAARAYASATPGGPASARFPGGQTEVWATFVFAAQPSPGLPVTITWTGPDGDPVAPPVETANEPTVTSFAKAGSGLPSGRWQATLRAGAKTVATLVFQIG